MADSTTQPAPEIDPNASKPPVAAGAPPAPVDPSQPPAVPNIAGSGGQNTDDLLSGYAGYQKAIDQASGLMGKDMASQQEFNVKIMDIEQREREGPLKRVLSMKPPELIQKDVPPAPDPNYRDPTEALGSMAAVFATLASAFTRAPLTTSLNAYAGIMTGFHAGDKELVDLQFKRWEAATKAAQAQNEIEQAKYKAIWNNLNFSVDQATAETKAFAVQREDATVVRQMEHSEYHDFGELILKRGEAGMRFAETAENAKMRLEMQRESLDLRKDQFNAAHPDGGNPEFLATVKAIANYQIPMTPVMERNPALVNAVLQTNPAYNTTAYKDFSPGGKVGTQIASVNTAIQHLDILDDMIDSLKNGDIKKVNELKNRAKEEFGFEAPTNFDAISSFIATEVTKAAGGGALGVTDREEVRSAFNKASSPEALHAAVNRFKGLMAGQLDSRRQQFDAVGNKNIDALLLPETKSQLDAVDRKSQKEPAKTGTGEAHIAVGPGGTKIYGDDEGNWFTDEAMTQPYKVK